MIHGYFSEEKMLQTNWYNTEFNPTYREMKLVTFITAESSGGGQRVVNRGQVFKDATVYGLIET